MNKTFILIAGLPASGKDTVADFFKKKGFFHMTYSSKILKPIIEENKLEEFINKTIKNPDIKIIKEASEYIENLKNMQKGRDLYISLAQYLGPLISKLTNNRFNHFTLFSTIEYKTQERIVIAGFRMKEELEILKKKYPDAKIIKFLIVTNNNTRYQRLMKRDNIDKKTIMKNEKYEKETTYDKLIKNIHFDFTIKNNKTEIDLEKQLNKLTNIQEHPPYKSSFL